MGYHSCSWHLSTAALETLGASGSALRISLGRAWPAIFFAQCCDQVAACCSADTGAPGASAASPPPRSLMPECAAAEAATREGLSHQRRVNARTSAAAEKVCPKTGIPGRRTILAHPLPSLRLPWPCVCMGREPPTIPRFVCRRRKPQLCRRGSPPPVLSSSPPVLLSSSPACAVVCELLRLSLLNHKKQRRATAVTAAGQASRPDREQRTPHHFDQFRARLSHVAIFHFLESKPPSSQNL